MLWRKKKKRKKATKPKAVTQTAAPQQPVEEIPQRITGLRRCTSRLFGLRDDSSGGADGWHIP